MLVCMSLVQSSNAFSLVSGQIVWIGVLVTSGGLTGLASLAMIMWKMVGARSQEIMDPTGKMSGEPLKIGA